jgi:hypothetical protein
LLCCPIFAANPDYESAQRKMAAIENGTAAPGSYVTFTEKEIEAWARVEVPKEVPEGFRDPRAELGENVATGRALIDFAALRHAKGAKSNWLIDKMIAGERPVAVTLEVHSSNGRCTVYLRRVEVGGVAATGQVLDFLVNTFFMPLYPNAKIGKPFELADNVESVSIRPAAVYVKIKDRRGVKAASGARKSATAERRSSGRPVPSVAFAAHPGTPRR